MNSTAGYLRLMRLSAGFRESRIILAANEFNLFTVLSEKQLRADEAAEKIYVDARALAIIMDALTAMGFLVKENDFYCNSEAAERFLVKGKPDYKGDLLKFMNGSWKHWGNLEETIKTGSADLEVDFLNQSQREHNQVYIRAMDNIGQERAERVARKLDLTNVKKMLDIAGGAATYSIAFARESPQWTSVILDLPLTLEVALENIEKTGLRNRISTRAESYWDAVYEPEFDLVLISQVIHGLSYSQCADLVKRAVKALAPGGRMIIHDSILSEDRISPYFAALFSAYMLATTEQGQCYTFNEVRKWMEGAGLDSIRRIELDGESEMIEGVRI
jgi:cyclopropane fatty-acyl-phospholipid synthase-like methyltransferase